MYIYEWVIIISHKIGGRNGYKNVIADAITHALNKHEPDQTQLLHSSYLLSGSEWTKNRAGIKYLSESLL